jgi:hypothetical protein
MARIKNLALLWKVSQAEVIRRAVSIAQAPASIPSPKTAFEDFLRSGSGLDPSTAEGYLKEVQEDRKTWRRE